MAKRSKLSLALLCALVAAVVLVSGSPAISQRSDPVARLQVRSTEEQPPDPYADTGVLVEAFVVEVKLPALYEMGVSPLGAGSHAVTVADILECLKMPEKATVVTGTKTLGTHELRAGQISQTEKVYRPRTRVVPTDRGSVSNVEYVAYSRGQEFSVQTRILSTDSVSLDYAFNYSGFFSGLQTDAEAPPSTASWEWSGTASVNTGQPTIVGATQDQASAFFLILTAHIEAQAS